MSFFHPLSRRLPLILLAAVLLAALPLLSDEAADAAYQESEDITSQCVISCSDRDPVTRLTDGDYTTYYKYPDDVTLFISSPEPVQGIYLIWNQIPGLWSLSLDGETSVQGEAGFIHDYVPAGGAREIEVTLPEAGAHLCDIYVFSEGTLPDWVQVWDEPYEQADLLVISTHSDDEEIFFGGVIPTYAGEYGYKVQVAYLTSHFRYEPVRPHELLCGLWTMGVRNYPVISELDDLKAFNGSYSAGDFAEYEVMLLRRFKPAVALIQDLKGEYGHATHILGSNAMLTAIDAAADPASFPESAEAFGTWELPKLYIHMYPDDQLTMDWHIPLRAFGGRDAFEMALEGFACHESQHILVFYPEEFGNGDCRLFGLYRSAVGSDTRADLMDNTGIIPSNGFYAEMSSIKTADDSPKAEANDGA